MYGVLQMWGCHGEWISFGGVTSSPGGRASWDPSPLLLEAVLVLGCCAQPGLCLGSLKLLSALRILTNPAWGLITCFCHCFP